MAHDRLPRVVPSGERFSALAAASALAASRGSGPASGAAPASAGGRTWRAAAGAASPFSHVSGDAHLNPGVQYRPASLQQSKPAGMQPTPQGMSYPSQEALAAEAPQALGVAAHVPSPQQYGALDGQQPSEAAGQHWSEVGQQTPLPHSE
jgi:hypothetical protein